MLLGRQYTFQNAAQNVLTQDHKQSPKSFARNYKRLQQIDPEQQVAKIQAQQNYRAQLLKQIEQDKQRKKRQKLQSKKYDQSFLNFNKQIKSVQKQNKNQGNNAYIVPRSSMNKRRNLKIQDQNLQSNKSQRYQDKLLEVNLFKDYKLNYNFERNLSLRKDYDILNRIEALKESIKFSKINISQQIYKARNNIKKRQKLFDYDSRNNYKMELSKLEIEQPYHSFDYENNYRKIFRKDRISDDFIEQRMDDVLKKIDSMIK